jgi:rRNA maturation endonuclease Nob1
MTTCNGCSAEMPENAKYCPNCGKNAAKTIVEEFDEVRRTSSED